MTSTVSLEWLQQTIDRSPFNRWMGMRAVSVSEDAIELAVRWREEFISNPAKRSTHGGILASVIDAASDYVIAVRVGEALPTVDLRVDFHRVATPGDLRARATVVHLGSKLASAETRIFDQQGKLVASGRGVYFTGGIQRATAA